MPNFLQDVLLQCSICMEPMRDSVRLCIQGHSVCCKCHNKLKTCPYCRSPWSLIRNRNMEKLIILYSIKMKISNELIENEYLKCPKCHVLMDENIILCGDGHSLCGRCVKNIIQCVLCNKLICYKRNFFLETFIKNVKVMNRQNHTKTKITQVYFN